MYPIIWMQFCKSFGMHYRHEYLLDSISTSHLDYSTLPQNAQRPGYMSLRAIVAKQSPINDVYSRTRRLLRRTRFVFARLALAPLSARLLATTYHERHIVNELITCHMKQSSNETMDWGYINIASRYIHTYRLQPTHLWNAEN